MGFTKFSSSSGGYSSSASQKAIATAPISTPYSSPIRTAAPNPPQVGNEITFAPASFDLCAVLSVEPSSITNTWTSLPEMLSGHLFIQASTVSSSFRAGMKKRIGA